MNSFVTCKIIQPFSHQFIHQSVNPLSPFLVNAGLVCVLGEGSSFGLYLFLQLPLLPVHLPWDNVICHESIIIIKSLFWCRNANLAIQGSPWQEIDISDWLDTFMNPKSNWEMTKQVLKIYWLIRNNTHPKIFNCKQVKLIIIVEDRGFFKEKRAR